MASFEEELKDKIGTKTLHSLDGSTIGGGCISQARAYKMDDGSRIFVKRSKGQEARLMFEGEIESLKCIKLTNTIKCPKPITLLDDPTTQDPTCAIVIEYINLGTLGEDKGFDLGQKLAKLHMYNEDATKHELRLSKWVGKKIPMSEIEASKLKELTLEDDIISRAYNLQPKSSNESPYAYSQDKYPLKAQANFGFDLPTSCGALPQVNDWCDDWMIFFARNRLNHQIQMLEQDYGDRELIENWSNLQIKIDKFFKEFKSDENNIRPALLHGDLWSGNLGVDLETDEGVVYDPSSFYGHHEYDFGIAAMFGGIPETFYDGYFKMYKKSVNFEKRVKLYQLFHQLNHWNHFGRGYRASTISLMKQLNCMTL